MDDSFRRLAGSIISIALIVIATRWLFGATGAQIPQTRGGANVYGIKWQWRAVGLGGAAFWVVATTWSWHELHSRPDGVLIAITLTFVTIGLWLATGSVSTDQTGITKRALGHPRSFLWRDITEIRLHERQGGAIELRAGPQKLVIDSRFVAFQHLLTEIEDRTHLRPSGASP